jgi:hypothetical protein
MPALYLFHRRTLLAGDDLQLPSIAWASSSAVQLLIFLPCLLYYTIALLLLATPPSSLLSLTSSFNNDADNEILAVDARQLYNDDASANDANSNSQSTTIMLSTECSTSTSNYTNMTFPHLLLFYLIGIAIYTSTSLYYERRIFHLSSLGTPTMNTHLRNAPLAKLIEFKMTYLTGWNFILLVYGIIITCIYLPEYIQCFPTIWWIVWASNILFQIVQCLLIVTTLVSLWSVHPVVIVTSPSNAVATTTTDLYHRHNADITHHLHHTHNNIEIAEEMWRARCQGCCRLLAVSTCFLFGGRGIVSHAADDAGGGGGGEKFYGDIARALADYFADFGDYESGGGGQEGGSGLDVVPSDIGLGIVLLRHIQAQRKMLAQRDAHQQQRQQQQETNAPSGNYGSSRCGGSEQVVSGGASTDRSTLLFRRSTSQLSSAPCEDCESVPPQPLVSTHTEEEAYRSFSRTVLSPSNSEHYALIEEGAHFSRHQLAIYTVSCCVISLLCIS